MISNKNLWWEGPIKSRTGYSPRVAIAKDLDLDLLAKDGRVDGSSFSDGGYAGGRVRSGTWDRPRKARTGRDVGLRPMSSHGCAGKSHLS
jgi:hypothetical protein